MGTRCHSKCSGEYSFEFLSDPLRALLARSAPSQRSKGQILHLPGLRAVRLAARRYSIKMKEEPLNTRETASVVEKRFASESLPPSRDLQWLSGGRPPPS